jgi:hypothetical protein
MLLAVIGEVICVCSVKKKAVGRRDAGADGWVPP